MKPTLLLLEAILSVNDLQLVRSKIETSLNPSPLCVGDVTVKTKADCCAEYFGGFDGYWSVDPSDGHENCFNHAIAEMFQQVCKLTLCISISYSVGLLQLPHALMKT